MKIPREYIVQKLYAFCGKAKYIASSGIYNAGCCVCHEGKSWGKKKRLYYIPEENFLVCYNCNRAWHPAQWVHEVTGLSYSQIKDEVNEGDFNTIESVLQEFNTFEKRINSFTLPQDCINLFDPQQLSYYTKNKTIQDALQFTKNRRLDTAINRPDKLWFSLKDFIHKNRIVIPFYDPDNQIRFYQSRAIYPKDEEVAKYLSKLNSEKTLYGLKNINTDLDYLFLFEGPIDAMFVQNGIGVTGLKLTDFQKKLLQKYSLFKHIWVLDNDINKNDDVKKQYLQLIESGKTVFIWPNKYKKFKDVNQLCIALKLDQIKPEFFINNSFSGQEALLRST